MHFHILFLCAISAVNGARILAVLPTPAYSHQSVFKVYIQALAERGHEIVVIKPTTKVNYATRNVTEVDATLAENYFKNLVKQSSVFRKRGIISDSTTVTAHNYMGLVRMIRDQFDLPAVKRLINNRKNEHFDLLICEAFMDYSLIFSHLFGDLPVIQISSGYGLAENFETMGAVSRHPKYYPNMWRDRFRDLTVWETINEIYMELTLQNEFSKLVDEQNKLIRSQFGRKSPSIKELRNRVQMLFVNTHSVFDNNRPVPPSVQYLGGIHLHRNEPVPLDDFMKRYLDGATQGAVYVSFGSSINTKDTDADFKYMLLQTFKALPYKILFKFETDDEELNSQLPYNVLVQTWFNQPEVLKHKNVVAFVTQGGVQSTDEAIDAGVPMVGLPMMGDQSFNTDKYVELGIGLALDTATVDSNQLTEAIKTVINDPLYRKNILELRHNIRHQPITPIRKAVWYTDYVINLKNSKNIFKTKAANVDYNEYYMTNMIIEFVTYTIMNQFKNLLKMIYA
ncbi:egt [Cryptophlebia peltastica nucleopolyhedrovirus]|uniref:Ecdysteroid UDP-glucosyltransferase n=1 Tax=Cryptophlebia peltastica nucleopolyhedrovirus TaxID=2304025 RepID=A0A346RNZ1_9ABAC|nr:egt [Cryptophlebia peltastica nucleopolyhedrovirus]AXS67788.1 egt [Cryptophlebia peltastica nucleopolyhedrovirus]